MCLPFIVLWRGTQGKHVVQAVVGRYHSFAITSDGEVYSWGLNDWGQLGRPAKVGCVCDVCHVCAQHAHVRLGPVLWEASGVMCGVCPDSCAH